jgi:hypothetical protein
MDLLMEHDERPHQAPTNSIEDVKNSIASEVLSTIKAEASSSEERLISRFETIMGRRCEDQMRSDRNARSQSEMNSKISSIERELDSIKLGMTQIHEEQKNMAREQNTMARNLEQMNLSLHRVTGDHSIVSNATGPLLLLVGLWILRRRRMPL